MTQDPHAQSKPARFDTADLYFFAGLILLGIGLAFWFSWPVALTAVGAVLTLVSLIAALPARRGG